MNTQSKKYFACIGAVLATLLFVWTDVRAGDLEPTSGPDNAASAMYTLEDLYNRLATGDNGTKRSGGAVEPTDLVQSGRTIDEVMAKAPETNDAQGATAADVTADKIFWGVTSGEWGLKVGTRDSTDPCRWPCGRNWADDCYLATNRLWCAAECESYFNLSEDACSSFCDALYYEEAVSDQYCTDVP